MEASQFEAVVQVSDGIHGDFAEVSDTGKRDEKGSSLRKRGSTVAPFNSHRHEGLNPSTRAIMFDVHGGRRPPVLHPLVRVRHSSSEARSAFMDSSEGKVASWLGQSGSSTPFIFLRSEARLSSGDHFNGAAAWARSPHDGQVVCKEKAPHVRHCCIRCLAMMLTHVLRWPRRQRPPCGPEPLAWLAPTWIQPL